MTFNEANTVEAFIRDRLCGGVTHHTAVGTGFVRRNGEIFGLGWHFLAPQNPSRRPHEFFQEADPCAVIGPSKATPGGSPLGTIQVKGSLELRRFGERIRHA